MWLKRCKEVGVVCPVDMIRLIEYCEVICEMP